jgi:hypothetical protein
LIRSKDWHSRAATALSSLTGNHDPIAAIRSCVDVLLEQVEITEPPVNLSVVASFRGVRSIQAAEIAVAGRLIPQGDGYIIEVNRRHSFEKRRFTGAHDICHTFFKEALASRTPITDLKTGVFDIRQEEEYLCDVGAGHLLLHPNWLIPMAQSREPGLDNLFSLARDCQASVEATALQVAHLSVWPCSFVFWELGLRKSQRVAQEQLAFDHCESLTRPEKRLRVKRVYGPEGAPFIPGNKSVPSESAICRALAERTRTTAVELVYTGRQAIRARCDSECAPYHLEDGTLQDRVITCILWDDDLSQPRTPTRTGSYVQAALCSPDYSTDLPSLMDTRDE